MKFKPFVKLMVLIVCALFSLCSTSTSVSVYLIGFDKTLNLDNNECFDMLIFISPQYADDLEVLNAIDSYISCVNDELGWNSEVISLTSEMNDYKKIDEIIEEYYDYNPIKACIMVGEDIGTALRCDTDYEEAPSTVPWYTTGGTGVYEVVKEGMNQKPYKMDICISLLYPTNDLDYQTKKTQIISVFQKFTSERQINYNGDLLVFIDSDLADTDNGEIRGLYQTMTDYGDLFYKEDPSANEVDSSLNNLYSIFFVHGHSTPSVTYVNYHDKIRFLASFLDELNTPFFGATGCYISGWWSNYPDNNRLDSSITIDKSIFLTRIFNSPYLQAMVLGGVALTGFPYPISFIEIALPNLVKGQTLAESMIGKVFYGDSPIFVGDPTFHFTFENSPPQKPQIPSGIISGETGMEYSFSTSAINSDGEQVYYCFEWNDKSDYIWLGPFEPGEIATATHKWTAKGEYKIRVKAKDIHDLESGISDALTVTLIGNSMPNKPDIQGINNGLRKKEYQFIFTADDPNGDDLFYYIDWDDDSSPIEWTGPYKSKEEVKLNHTFNFVGTYNIKSKVKDVNESESSWTYYRVLISKTKNNNFNIKQWFFNNLISKFFILKSLII